MYPEVEIKLAEPETFVRIEEWLNERARQGMVGQIRASSQEEMRPNLLTPAVEMTIDKVGSFVRSLPDFVHSPTLQTRNGPGYENEAGSFIKGLSVYHFTWTRYGDQKHLALERRDIGDRYSPLRILDEAMVPSHNWLQELWIDYFPDGKGDTGIYYRSPDDYLLRYAPDRTKRYLPIRNTRYVIDQSEAMLESLAENRVALTVEPADLLPAQSY